MNSAAARHDISSAFYAAVAAIDVREITAAALSRPVLPNRTATVIACGKAAPRMAQGALVVLGNQASRVLVITTDGTCCSGLPASTRVLRASHPIPCERSLIAARQALHLARCTSSNNDVVVLVSGGTSALVCAPRPPITLSQKAEMISQMLASGAGISDVNVVRRHLSLIKGGGLATSTRARVECLIMSDVIGGAPHDIGSGIASADPTTIDDAKRSIFKHLGHDSNAALAAGLGETLKPGEPAATRLNSRIILGPEDLARQVCSQLTARGWQASMQIQGDIDVLQFAKLLSGYVSQSRSRQAFVVACEPTVRLGTHHHGVGGRAARTCLETLLVAGGGQVVVLGGASDGVDGNSNAAGACICADQLASAGMVNVRNALENFDDASVHRALGTHLSTGPTGLNLTDVYVVARY